MAFRSPPRSVYNCHCALLSGPCTRGALHLTPPPPHCLNMTPAGSHCHKQRNNRQLFFFCFLGLNPWYMEVPRLGVESELLLPVYTTATATWDLSCVCKLYHSSRQHWILNPLSDTRERTPNLMVPSRICFRCATTATPKISFYFFFFIFYFFVFLPFLGPLPRHMEVPRLGVESEL